MVMAKFRIAVGTVVERFHIVLSTEFDLVAVIINCCFKSLQFPVDKTSVGVDDRIRPIKLNSLIKV